MVHLINDRLPLSVAAMRPGTESMIDRFRVGSEVVIQMGILRELENRSPRKRASHDGSNIVIANVGYGLTARNVQKLID